MSADHHVHDTERWLSHAHRTLAAAGLRSGQARSAVMDVLAREDACLRTPQEIIDRVRQTRGGAAASVYRALEDLERHGLIRRVGGPDNVARIEIEHPGHHHHHFIDLATGNVVPFSDPAIEAAIAAVAERLGVELTAHEVTLHGVAARRSRAS